MEEIFAQLQLNPTMQMAPLIQCDLEEMAVQTEREVEEMVAQLNFIPEDIASLRRELEAMVTLIEGGLEEIVDRLQRSHKEAAQLQPDLEEAVELKALEKVISQNQGEMEVGTTAPHQEQGSILSPAGVSTGLSVVCLIQDGQMNSVRQVR
ncbi:hypothetical protein AAFF_G00241570 [Aldrovandia affinis]|uniref:Uncharacterized protein n=1 Tax=Aldrovandia affinis TaxID=143900 RepID=A0AAD7WTR0_9TELE|nr:hypothetical protein AAFF_G00241570 [Aldrovandia affinis]